MLFVAGRDGAAVFDAVEEPLDHVPEAIEIAAEGGLFASVGHRLCTSPAALRLHLATQSVAVVSCIGKQGLPRADCVGHANGRAPVMGLPGGESQLHR